MARPRLLAVALAPMACLWPIGDAGAQSIYIDSGSPSLITAADGKSYAADTSSSGSDFYDYGQYANCAVMAPGLLLSPARKILASTRPSATDSASAIQSPCLTDVMMFTSI